MTIEEIKAKYDAFAKSNRSILSDFSMCSYCGNKPNRYSFVNNNTKCINFDKVKDALLLDLKSVDSLYLSINNGISYFIEFKDSYYSNVHEDIVEKAIDSTFIHHNICCYSNYSNNEIVCVLSSKKSLQNNNMTSVMLRRSGYDTNKMYLNDLENRFENAFNEESINKCPIFKYDKFRIVFDDMFDSFVEYIK